MRTLLSHEATARWFAAGDHDKAEMLSSGGDESCTSLFRSPVRDVAGVAAGFPKKADILDDAGGWWWRGKKIRD